MEKVMHNQVVWLLVKEKKEKKKVMEREKGNIFEKFLKNYPILLFG